ncbi:hypothetical protein [Hydrogenimonas sp.]
MNSINTGNGDLLAKIQIDTMKKAMDVQSRDVLSVLQSATTQQQPTKSVSQHSVSQITKMGQNIDIKA